MRGQLQRGGGSKRRGRPRVRDSRKCEPGYRRGAGNPDDISEVLKAAAWRASDGIGHGNPHFDSGDAEGRGRGIREECERRVAFSLGRPEVRERLVSTVVLSEDE